MARSKPTDATAPGGKAGRGPKDAGRGRSSGSTAASGKAPKLDKKGQPKVKKPRTPAQLASDKAFGERMKAAKKRKEARA